VIDDDEDEEEEGVCRDERDEEEVWSGVRKNVRSQWSPSYLEN
jgi:hypothetical protein